MRRFVLAFAVGLVACGAQPSSPLNGASSSPAGGAPGAGLPPGPGAPAPRDDGRLPPTATPLRYSLALSVDPAQPRFRGTVKILVSVAQPTAFVVLNGRDLDVKSVTAHADGRAISGTATARIAHGGVAPEELVLTFAEKLPAGQTTLEIAYEAPFASTLGGLYRVQDGDRWYAFTQFEATDARRAFPCFDEPGFKTPFDVSITAPKGLIAVANAPETMHKDLGASTTFGFATTRPVPTYLVAFAVGDFDVRPGPTSPVPIRLVSTKGKSQLGGLAIEATTALVGLLGDYFGIRYPYEKLDIVAVPDFAAGAMENPGLITFREELLLLDPKSATTPLRRAQAQVIAHELAHQWFGNLVTMQWWDDLWLNEGFATWMEAKIVDKWRPSFGARFERVQEAQWVMDTDALPSARAVRQPVRSTGDAMDAFDGITYTKGASVLAMVEQWIGEDAFQKGVRDYVRANAWKNAKADDLLRALDLASNKDVSKVASSFLDKPGVPNVYVTPSCEKGQVSLRIRQAPWRPLGVPAAGGSTSAWTVPMCMLVEGTKGSVCALVSPETATKDLPGAKCPAWVYPNAEQSGYFRFALDAKQTAALAHAQGQLDALDRVGLVSNLWAQVRAGESAPDAYLDLLPAFDRETDRHVVEQIAGALHAVSDALVDDAARPAFRAYVATRFGAKKRELGWETRKGEPDDRALLRREVLLAMGELAEDDATLKEADALARAWLKDAASVGGDAAQVALELGSRRAGADRLEALRAAAKGAKTPQDRVLALRALGGFGEPELLKRALELTLTDEVRVSELRSIFGGALAHRASRPVVLEWIRARWDALRVKLAGPLARGLVYPVAHVCDAKSLEDARAFYAPHMKDVEGALHVVDEALETAGLCVALRERGAAATTQYFTAKAHGAAK